MSIQKGDVFFFLTIGEMPTAKATKALQTHMTRYGQSTPEDAKILCGLGGDGTQIRGIHAFQHLNKPFYGLNYGTSGYLLNAPKETEDLLKRIENAVPITLSMLCVETENTQGDVTSAFTVNEFFVCNQNRSQAVKLALSTGGQLRVPMMAGDGLLISTTVGSTGYTKNVGGTAVALSDDVMILTPHASDPNARFKSAIIPMTTIDVTVIEPIFRPADVYNDQGLVLKNATSARIYQAKNKRYTLLHDPDMTLEEKNMRAQFGQPLQNNLG